MRRCDGAELRTLSGRTARHCGLESYLPCFCFFSNRIGKDRHRAFRGLNGSNICCSSELRVGCLRANDSECDSSRHCAFSLSHLTKLAARQVAATTPQYAPGIRPARTDPSDTAPSPQVAPGDKFVPACLEVATRAVEGKQIGAGERDYCVLADVDALGEPPEGVVADELVEDPLQWFPSSRASDTRTRVWWKGVVYALVGPNGKHGRPELAEAPVSFVKHWCGNRAACQRGRGKARGSGLVDSLLRWGRAKVRSRRSSSRMRSYSCFSSIRRNPVKSIAPRPASFCKAVPSSISPLLASRSWACRSRSALLRALADTLYRHVFLAYGMVFLFSAVDGYLMAQGLSLSTDRMTHSTCEGARSWVRLTFIVLRVVLLTRSSSSL
ncbi:hypothetical protein BV20DRAFT_122442 [Pilatotrama ljubarskyi]|nr:hypothetical protein BV20DRAFT_122442 [Pilatotrama ljubarskyi]